MLSVRVQPSLSTTISAGAGAAAVALLAATLVGAAVGAGALLAQKVMQDPIEQLFSYEYPVRGSWSVARRGAHGAAAHRTRGRRRNRGRDGTMTRRFRVAAVQLAPVATSA